jgi:hypothetical protein
MKKLIILAIFALTACSTDKGCHQNCTAMFYDTKNDMHVYFDSDCNHVPPESSYIFVNCNKEGQ